MTTPDEGAGRAMPVVPPGASTTEQPPPWRQAVGRVEAVALLAIVVVAALARFVGLAARGSWDADQGTEMLVLRALVRDGSVPLLGPVTSNGTFHHGALYYDLLAPAAWLGGASPTWVVAEIALGGVLAVVAAWWAVRAIGGPVAGLVAAGLLAVSATAIASSTFIWNPNLLALASAVTLGAAWRAWDRRQPRWWLVAAPGVAVAAQLHVLGSLLVLPVGGLWLAHVRREWRTRGRVVGWAVAGAAVAAATYLQLLAYELGHGFAETRAIVAFLRTPGGASDSGPLVRILDGALRIVSWPLTGLFTDALLPTALVTAAVIVAVAWRFVAGDRHERQAVAWLALSLGACIVVLSLTVGGITTVVAALPTDQYHSFLDPFVLAIVGLAAAALLARGVPDRALAVVALVALVAWNVAAWPPAVAADGGWPAAQDAAVRIAATTGTATVEVVSLPDFKPPDAYVFPLEQAGHTVVAVEPGSAPSAADEAGVGAVVIVCDAAFVSDCGGAAERSWWAAHPALAARLGLAGADPAPADRFTAAPGRTVSVYR